MKKRQQKKEQVKKEASTQRQHQAKPDLRGVKRLKLYFGIFILFFAFCLYAQTIGHDFTLDDGPAIGENRITTQGLSGIPTLLKTDYWYGLQRDGLRGPVYRPVSLTIFATIWEISPNNPQLYHFVNVLCYALTCLLLFLVLYRLFKNLNLIFPFVCTLLYAAHPIHTEVVNSVKSLDEILCFLFGLSSIWFFLKHVSLNSKLSLILGGISFFLSLLSKETGITFLVIIPLIFYFFTDTSLKKISASWIFLAAFAGIWLLIRMAVFKDLPPNAGSTISVLDNTLSAAPDFKSRVATIFYILFRYVLLLFYPNPLSSDYSFFQIRIHSMGDPMVLIGIAFYVAILIYSIVNFRKKSIVAFGILFFLITLAPVSNLFIMIGSTMAERFLYIPSLGFCIVLSHFLIKFTITESIKSTLKNIFQLFTPRLAFIVLIISTLYCLKTYSRSKDWKDNETLLSQDVKTSPNSARTNQILGTVLMLSGLNSGDQQNLTLAKFYLKRSFEIYPDNFATLSYLGRIYLYEKQFDSATYFLRKGVSLMPSDIELNHNLGWALSSLKQYDEAAKVLTHLIELNPKQETPYYNLAGIYYNMGDYDKALYYYSKTIELNPNKAQAYYYSGLILNSKGEAQKSTEYINKAAALGFKPN